MSVQLKVNTDRWDRNYNNLIELGIGRYFKNRAINRARFYEIVRDKELKILDVGCGAGRFLISLMENGFLNLSGIEPERELTRNIPSQIKIINCPAEKILFDDNSFDIVFIYGVLHHLKGKDAWLKSFNEINRVLKHGGYLFIMEPCSKFVYKVLELSSKVLGFTSGHIRILGEMIKEESRELYDFIDNYKIYEKFIYEHSYDVIVNKRTIFTSPIVQWVLTARKP